MTDVSRLVPGNGPLGLVATLVTIATIDVLVRATLLVLPNPVTLALVGVVYTGFAGGVRYGIVAALFVVAYAVYFFGLSGPAIGFDALGLRRAIAFAIGSPLVGWMCGALRERADHEHLRHLTRERDQAEELRQVAERLRHGERQLRLVIDAVPAMIAYLDSDKRFQFCNRLYCEAYGRSEQQIVGRYLREVIGDAAFDVADAWADRALAGETVSYERRHVWPDGRRSEFAVSYVPHKTDDGTMIGFFAMLVDVTARKAEQSRLLFLSRHDALTGLPNRIQLNERITQAIARARRSKRPLALMFLDLDGFKAVNDRHGHAVGDQLLREVADRLMHCVRITDTVARIGGDEFVILLEGLNHDEDAHVVSRKLIATMSEPFRIDGLTLYSGLSVGVAVSAGDAIDPEALLKRADAAMYEAKSGGRNNYRVAESATV